MHFYLFVFDDTELPAAAHRRDDLHNHEEEVKVGQEEQVDEEAVVLKIILPINKLIFIRTTLAVWCSGHIGC
jgi:hypothetical protein